MSTGQHSAWFALFIQLWEGPGGQNVEKLFQLHVLVRIYTYVFK